MMAGANPALENSDDENSQQQHVQQAFLDYVHEGRFFSENPRINLQAQQSLFEAIIALVQDKSDICSHSNISEALVLATKEDQIGLLAFIYSPACLQLIFQSAEAQKIGSPESIIAWYLIFNAHCLLARKNRNADRKETLEDRQYIQNFNFFINKIIGKLELKSFVLEDLGLASINLRLIILGVSYLDRMTPAGLRNDIFIDLLAPLVEKVYKALSREDGVKLLYEFFKFIYLKARTAYVTIDAPVKDWFEKEKLLRDPEEGWSVVKEDLDADLCDKDGKFISFLNIGAFIVNFKIDLKADMHKLYEASQEDYYKKEKREEQKKRQEKERILRLEAQREQERKKAIAAGKIHGIEDPEEAQRFYEEQKQTKQKEVQRQTETLIADYEKRCQEGLKKINDLKITFEQVAGQLQQLNKELKRNPAAQQLDSLHQSIQDFRRLQQEIDDQKSSLKIQPHFNECLNKVEKDFSSKTPGLKAGLKRLQGQLQDLLKKNKPPRHKEGKKKVEESHRPLGTFSPLAETQRELVPPLMQEPEANLLPIPAVPAVVFCNIVGGVRSKASLAISAKDLVIPPRKVPREEGSSPFDFGFTWS